MHIVFCESVLKQTWIVLMNVCVYADTSTNTVFSLSYTTKLLTIHLSGGFVFESKMPHYFLKSVLYNI